MNQTRNSCQTHCCLRHGCKYGYDNCPVETGTASQAYACEQCGYETDPGETPTPFLVVSATDPRVEVAAFASESDARAFTAQNAASVLWVDLLALALAVYRG